MIRRCSLPPQAVLSSSTMMTPWRKLWTFSASLKCITSTVRSREFSLMTSCGISAQQTNALYPYIITLIYIFPNCCFSAHESLVMSALILFMQGIISERASSVVERSMQPQSQRTCEPLVTQRYMGPTICRSHALAALLRNTSVAW